MGNHESVIRCKATNRQLYLAEEIYVQISDSNWLVIFLYTSYVNIIISPPASFHSLSHSLPPPTSSLISLPLSSHRFPHLTPSVISPPPSSHSLSHSLPPLTSSHLFPHLTSSLISPPPSSYLLPHLTPLSRFPTSHFLSPFSSSHLLHHLTSSLISLPLSLSPTSYLFPHLTSLIFPPPPSHLLPHLTFFLSHSLPPLTSSIISPPLSSHFLHHLTSSILYLATSFHLFQILLSFQSRHLLVTRQHHLQRISLIFVGITAVKYNQLVDLFVNNYLIPLMLLCSVRLLITSTEKLFNFIGFSYQAENSLHVRLLII